VIDSCGCEAAEEADFSFDQERVRSFGVEEALLVCCALLEDDAAVAADALAMLINRLLSKNRRLKAHNFKPRIQRISVI